MCNGFDCQDLKRYAVDLDLYICTMCAMVSNVKRPMTKVETGAATQGRGKGPVGRGQEAAQAISISRHRGEYYKTYYLVVAHRRWLRLRSAV